MKARTYDEIRDAIYNEIVAVFPGYRVYDFGNRETFRGQDFIEIELPSITYSLYMELDYSRVVDEYTEIDLERNVGRVTEMIPYKARITIGCHSEFQKEAEQLSQMIHSHWGHAPCFAGIGCRLHRVAFADALETGGVYSYEFSWVGWVRLAGRRQEYPLIRDIQYSLDVLPEEEIVIPVSEEPPVSELPPASIEVSEVGEEPLQTGQANLLE